LVKILICPSCGVDNSEELYCGNCGYNLKNELLKRQLNESPLKSGNSASLKEKSFLKATMLNFFLPGIGHVYIGRNKRGWIIFFIMAFLTSFIFIFPAILIVFPLSLVSWIGIWSFTLFDGNFLTNKYNFDLQTKGYAPW
jgi:hypothetical protein